MIAPVSFEYLNGGIGTAGGKRGKVSTRRLFPQVTADLSQRWCSPALKIDVASIAINNEPMFKKARILFLTGERRQESAARSRYAECEQHRTHTRSRHVDHWRMVIDWTEEMVWSVMREFGVMPHPAYRLRWNRVSSLAYCFSSLSRGCILWREVRPVEDNAESHLVFADAQFLEDITEFFIGTQGQAELKRLEFASDTETFLAEHATATISSTHFAVEVFGHALEGGQLLACEFHG